MISSDGCQKVRTLFSLSLYCLCFFVHHSLSHSLSLILPYWQLSHQERDQEGSTIRRENKSHYLTRGSPVTHIPLDCVQIEETCCCWFHFRWNSSFPLSLSSLNLSPSSPFSLVYQVHSDSVSSSPYQWLQNDQRKNKKATTKETIYQIS